MALPFFYVDDVSATRIVLDEDTSKHIAGVLRMKTGETILLTDGKGTKAQATITDDNRKRCTVHIDGIEKEAEKRNAINSNNPFILFENFVIIFWFLSIIICKTKVGICKAAVSTKLERIATILISSQKFGGGLAGLSFEKTHQMVGFRKVEFVGYFWNIKLRMDQVIFDLKQQALLQ